MNVLIIGNGFDRKIGLKTDFLSFIDWMKKRGYGVGDRFRKQSEKINFPFITHPGQTRIDNYTKFKGVHIQYAGEIFTIRNWTVDKNLDESTESRLSNDLLYLLPEITGNETLSKTSQPNIWYCFIQLLLFQSKTNLLDISASEFTQYINTNGNWVDLEGLIQKSIEVRVTQDHFRDGIFSITNHFDVFSLANLLLLDIKDHRQKAKGEIYKAVWLDFLEFK
ncbi:MAG TPA: AbiH family protein, partial [Ferruginibacter sp.]|nr:AbiH family protein [Ferruginibacter sp.]